MNLEATLWLAGAAILPSALVAWIACFGVRALAPIIGLIDKPNEERKVHTEPTPLGGGVAIWLGVVTPFAVGQAVLAALVFSGQIDVTPPRPMDPDVPAAAKSVAEPTDPSWIPAFARPHLAGLWQQSGRLWALLGCGTVLMLLGLADDRWQLGWQIRLVVQFIVAGIAVFGLGWRLTLFWDQPILTGVVSLFWIVGLVNAFNMLDNMDGLSAGVGAIACAALAGVMLLAPDPETGQPQLFVGGFLLVLAGALFGFLGHNRPPAKLFMGDAGSYFLGFCLAVTTLLASYTGYQGQRQHAILAPLIAMAVPLYDMVSVLYLRVREGRSPFQADKRHFSHRLVALGFDKSEAVLTIYLLAAACGLAALLLHRTDFVGAVIVVLLVGSVLALIGVFETIGGRSFEK